MTLDFMSIMCTHEAAHAILACRIALPFHYIRVEFPPKPGGSHLLVDTLAIHEGNRYLTGTGQSTVQLWAGYLAVLRIAQYVNQYHNQLDANIAEQCAREDITAYEQTLSQLQHDLRAPIVQETQRLVNEAIQHAAFTKTLERVANALLQKREMTEDEAYELVDSGNGSTLLLPRITASFEHARDSAFFCFTRREIENASPLDDWLRAERGLTYAKTISAQGT